MFKPRRLGVGMKTKPNKNLPVKRYEKPSLFKKNKLEAARKSLVEALRQEYQVTERVADEIIDNDETWQQILKLEDKFWTVKGLRQLMPQLFEAAMTKAKSGWTANAKDAVVAMNILKEKLIPESKNILNIGGKNVQINMGFNFKPYKDKRKANGVKSASPGTAQQVKPL